MRAHFGLPSVRGEQDQAYKRAPITVKFEIPYFTVSGIQVSGGCGRGGVGGVGVGRVGVG